MAVRFHRYAPVLLFLVAAGAAACGGSAASPTSPEALASVQSSVAVEPRVVNPEFLPTGSCAGGLPFGLRLRVILPGGRDLALRRLRFHLLEPGGGTAFPEVIPVPTGSEAAFSPMQPIPTPGITTSTATTIPIPGLAPLTGIPVAASTSRPLPFFLRFACSVIPAGTVIVAADLENPAGRVTTSEARVPVAAR